MAVPITVLQKKEILFQPPLSADKKDALETIHAGVIVKVTLSLWWLSPEDSVSIIDRRISWNL